MRHSTKRRFFQNFPVLRIWPKTCFLSIHILKPIFDVDFVDEMKNWKSQLVGKVSSYKMVFLHYQKVFQKFYNKNATGFLLNNLVKDQTGNLKTRSVWTNFQRFFRTKNWKIKNTKCSSVDELSIDVSRFYCCGLKIFPLKKRHLLMKHPSY